jgi:hypothetical protein
MEQQIQLQQVIEEYGRQKKGIDDEDQGCQARLRSVGLGFIRVSLRPLTIKDSGGVFRVKFMTGHANPLGSRKPLG